MQRLSSPLTVKTMAAIFGISVLTACAHSRPLRLQAKDDLSQGNFDAAEKKLLSQEVVSESKSRLLTLMGLGTVAHAKGQFEKSTEYLRRAVALAGELYTTSITEGALTVVTNDNAAKYTGHDYELSMLHYYLVMNQLMIAQEGKVAAWEMLPLKDGDRTVMEGMSKPERVLTPKEIAEYQNRARSEVLAWDSFLETVRRKNRGIAAYKDDIAAKIVGAYVHRISGSREDLGTAKILYENAQGLLVKSYSLFPTFNAKSAEFREGYRTLASQDIDAIKKNYTSPTAHYKSLEKYLELSSSEVNGGQENTLVVLESGMVPEKTEKTYNVGIGAAFNAISDKTLRTTIAAIGYVALVQFAPTVIYAGLIEEAIDQNNNEQVTSNDGSKTIGNAIDKAIGFKFKLPTVPLVATDVDYKVVFSSAYGKNTEVPLVAVNPVSDFARHDVEAKSSAIVTKTGIRVGVKYMAALVAAYTAYQATLKASESTFLATFAATTTWMIGKKAVDATESADIRAWNMLPQTVSMMETKLAPGEYSAVAVGTRGTETWNFDLGKFQVRDNEGKNVFSRRIYFTPKPAIPPRGLASTVLK